MVEPQREPEIEAMARVARGFLWLLRRVFWLIGAAAVAFGICLSLDVGEGWTFIAPYAAVSSGPGAGSVWVCLGLPLVLRADWLFGRSWLRLLCLGAALWFLPSLLPDDHAFGFVARVFASLVACLTLLVWRTLWRLTSPAPVAAPD